MLQKEKCILINSIKKKLDVMTKSKYRTTNFSVIEFFAFHNFQPLNMESLILNLVVDYNSNPNKYVLSNEISHFKSQKTFENSIKNSINKNKSFVKGPGDGQLSLNYQKTLEYLNTMFNKYKTNSRDIKTPVKIPKKKNEEPKRPKVKQIKHEKNSDSEDSEYESKNYKKKKVNNLDFRSPEKVSQPKNHRINERKNFKLEKEDESGIFSIKDSDSDSLFTLIKKEVKKENNNAYISDIPNIFFKELIKNNLTSSLEQDDIFEAIKNINDYLQYIEELNKDGQNIFIEDKEMDEKNKKLQEIKNYLKQLCENKMAYDVSCDEVRNWQNELLNIYKVMQSELYAVKIELNNKTYCFDSYAKLRDIIFGYKTKYEQVVDIISKKLNEIKDIEINSIDKQIFIKSLLDNINIKKKLISSIEKAVKINEVFSFNQIIVRQISGYNRQNEMDYLHYIKEISDTFLQEKNKIIDTMVDIDKDIGNISLIN
mgnify:FL=1